ncbi:MAG: helix-turn-helix domain-containing protein [Oscillospiraceae bacterium]|jgi:transcriptional regulator with XRE-family HTH domain|nr:helix-turn-helix domain-containing protein [Oscillospiraceae bacterium]
MNLGEKILQLRKVNGMSQEELASQLTISRQAISKWELGESVPDTENVLQLSKLFGVSTDYLLNDNYENSHEIRLSELPVEAKASNGKNAIMENVQAKSRKPPLLLDIVFVFVTVLATLSILQLPALIGYSVLGFLTVALQVVAVLYVPTYLFIVRPRKMKCHKVNALIGKSAIMNRVFWGAGASVALFVCYLLCRHIFIELHNNTGWPMVMFLLGLVVVFIAAFLGAKKVIVCTATGYVVSFIVGIVFNYEYDFIVDGIVQSRNYTAWVIWTVTFLVLIVAGIFWEVISKRIKGGV